MSDTTLGDYAGGADTSASEVFFGAGPAESADYDPADDYDPGAVEDDYADYANVEEYGGPPDLAELVEDALSRGAGNAEAMLEARQRADEYDAERRARNAYEQHVQYQAALAEAVEEGEDLIADAARGHGVSNAQVDSGFVREVADALLDREQRISFDRGDTERWEWLQTPAGAEAAIEEAARRTRIGEFAQHAHKGLGREGFAASEARARRDFDNFAQRSGLVSIRGVG